MEGPVGFYLEYITGLSDNLPDAVGLHTSASHMADTAQAAELLLSMRVLNPRVQLTDSRATMLRTAQDLLKHVPQLLDTPTIAIRFGNSEDALCVALQGECNACNRQLTVIGDTLRDLIYSLSNNIPLSPALARIHEDLLLLRVPKIWDSTATTNGKVLATFMTELAVRTSLLSEWLDEDLQTIWLGAFQDPQAIVTAVLQNFCREERVLIDDAAIVCTVAPPGIRKAPKKGFLLQDLFIHGAAWDAQKRQLTEASNADPTCPAPLLQLKAQKITETERNDSMFQCPLYSSAVRAADGLFAIPVLMASIPTQLDPAHWRKRGVALLCSRPGFKELPT